MASRLEEGQVGVAMHFCECEHSKHFDGANPAHVYGVPVPHAELKDVRTDFGYYRVCEACVREGCLKADQ